MKRLWQAEMVWRRWQIIKRFYKWLLTFLSGSHLMSHPSFNVSESSQLLDLLLFSWDKLWRALLPRSVSFLLCEIDADFLAVSVQRHMIQSISSQPLRRCDCDFLSGYLSPDWLHIQADPTTPTTSACRPYMPMNRNKRQALTCYSTLFLPVLHIWGHGNTSHMCWKPWGAVHHGG